jgi:RNA polymerase sigma-70 factor (ECF subfamily)
MHRLPKDVLLSPTSSVDAAGATLERHRERIYLFALGMLRDPSIAEDAAQETLLRAYRGIDSLRDPAALTTWLYRIATRVCIDLIRNQSRAASSAPEADLDELEDLESPSLQQVVERADMSSCVQIYIEGLSDGYRSAILMHDLEGLTSAEIASALGLTVATVKMRLHRARLRLRAQMEADCALTHDERNVLVCEPAP